ncbi:alpha/beta fold hydrolase [Halosolutus halophilus]|uniref:alpha/beta fold hydrolase n=1 Tax=Halosolutus halophilus TaxID=1552990 RepID=UPI00223514C7|nr:alpha/beta hydrolase [Halosolutus halophilus]
MASFETAQDQLFEEMSVDPQSQFIDLDHPQVRTHVIETGDEGSDDVPVFCVHGTGAFGALFTPLIAHLDDTWTIATDRPGYGLSGDHTYTAQTFRQTAVTVLEGILDRLGIEQVDLVGNSAGGYWSMVFALARPNRVRHLTLIGSVPTFPGTRPPIPLRLFSVPLLNRLLARLQESSEDGVVEQFEIFGEDETIQDYPSLIRVFVTQARKPRSDIVDISEFNSLLRLRGWHPSTRLREDELADLQPSTLVAWGENDPLGGPDVVRNTVDRIPDSRLETVNAGHLPWLGHPETCAELILDMRR